MAGNYEGDRGVPSEVNPTFSLRFDGRELIAVSESARYSGKFPAFSGHAHPVSEAGWLYQEFDYTKKAQALQNVGPIPEGRYWIVPDELKFNDPIYRQIGHPLTAWGHRFIRIHPYPETNTFGRGGFHIHGGDTPGSAGCIDLVDKMDAFAAFLARSVPLSLKGYGIVLEVRYVVEKVRLDDGPDPNPPLPKVTRGEPYMIQDGDWLSKIAGRKYQDVYLWPIIYDANVAVIGPDPNKIIPKTKILIPFLSQYSPEEVGKARERGKNWKK